MIGVKFITLGTLKESYLREAAAEYGKRLGAFCRFELCELKEERLSDHPSQAEIQNALVKEAAAIEKQIPPKAFRVAMCVEGKQLSSEELADTIEEISGRHSEICFIIGSSYGLDESVKRSAHLRLSVSKLTFPHQLLRAILCEATYRALSIINGTKYHK